MALQPQNERPFGFCDKLGYLFVSDAVIIGYVPQQAGGLLAVKLFSGFHCSTSPSMRIKSVKKDIRQDYNFSIPAHIMNKI